MVLAKMALCQAGSLVLQQHADELWQRRQRVKSGDSRRKQENCTRRQGNTTVIQADAE